MATTNQKNDRLAKLAMKLFHRCGTILIVNSTRVRYTSLTRYTNFHRPLTSYSFRIRRMATDAAKHALTEADKKAGAWVREATSWVIINLWTKCFWFIQPYIFVYVHNAYTLTYQIEFRGTIVADAKGILYCNLKLWNVSFAHFQSAVFLRASGFFIFSFCLRYFIVWCAVWILVTWDGMRIWEY